MGLHQIKNFFASKKTIMTIKQTPTEWKRIFASYSSDKRLISRTYKECPK
jgi:DNA replication protein DnaC